MYIRKYLFILVVNCPINNNIGHSNMKNLNSSKCPLIKVEQNKRANSISVRILSN